MTDGQMDDTGTESDGEYGEESEEEEEETVYSDGLQVLVYFDLGLFH